MSLRDIVLNTTPYPALSLLVAVVLLVLVLFLARSYVYRTVTAVTRMLRSTARLAAASVLELEEHLSRSHRRMLHTKTLEEAARSVEQEAAQFQAALTTYFRKYTALNQRISEAVSRVEEDHRRTMDVPPSLPNWQPILEALAGIRQSEDVPMAPLLAGIDHTLQEQHRAALASHAGAVRKRHAILSRLLPLCSRLDRRMQTVARSLQSLEKRAGRLDRAMQSHTAVLEQVGDPHAPSSQSSLAQLFTSGLVLLVVAGGALINFHLMELPMSEVFGDGSYLGPWKISQVAALVVTTVELSLGIFLAESLQITRMIPVIAALDDPMRVRLSWMALIFLILFAGLESLLGLLRVHMVADIQQLERMLSGTESPDAFGSSIPAAGQMILGFVLPFWIACGAVPLASFALAARTFSGFTMSLVLRFLAAGLRLFGNTAVYAGRLATALYDMLIFPVLLLENALAENGESRTESRESGLSDSFFQRLRKRRNASHWPEKSR